MSHILSIQAKWNNFLFETFWDFSAILRVHSIVYSMLLFESQYVYFILWVKKDIGSYL